MAAANREIAHRPGRHRSRLAWHVLRWPLFGLLVLTALVLGYVGFERYFGAQAEPHSTTDVLYLTLQLFTLQSGYVPDSGAPWQLEVARLMAPATTGTAIVVGLLAAFREEIAEVRLRFRKRHVVVCGLGEMGSQLARALLEAGYSVVGIERSTSGSVNVREIRRAGALVIEGDARSLEVLARARVQHATHVVALTGTDDHNAEVAMRCRDLAPEGGVALTCLAHIMDPSLCALLRSEELAAAHDANIRVDFFNIYERAARELLRGFPPESLESSDPALAIIGLGDVGQAVVVEAARLWHSQTAHRPSHIHISLVDPSAKQVADLLRSRYPQLEHAAVLMPIAVDFEHLDYAALRDASPWHGLFVCIDESTDALEVALKLRRVVQDPVPVGVELTQSPGMGELLARPDAYDGIEPFDLFDLTLQPELLLGGTYEILARAIHREYVEEQRRQGATSIANAAMVPWEQLPASLKESNRDQAAHIGTKLTTVGWAIGPLTDWDADRIEFSSAVVEELAELEHQRWVEQRLRDGWKLGPKDVEAKTSPHLVSWNDLTDEVKEWDRRAVRGIPGFLSRAGYQLVSGRATSV